jgi:hypothetical protein
MTVSQSRLIIALSTIVFQEASKHGRNQDERTKIGEYAWRPQ